MTCRRAVTQNVRDGRSQQSGAAGFRRRKTLMHVVTLPDAGRRRCTLVHQFVTTRAGSCWLRAAGRFWYARRGDGGRSQANPVAGTSSISLTGPVPKKTLTSRDFARWRARHYLPGDAPGSRAESPEVVEQDCGALTPATTRFKSMSGRSRCTARSPTSTTWRRRAGGCSSS